jgi:L-ascorbate metabolism protein UlaG (beta-lactamase superfamily)
LQQIRYFGTSCFEIVGSSGSRLIVDPYLDGNEHAAAASADIDELDLILVTHGGFDHLGDAFALAKRTGAMLFASADVAIAAKLDGIPEDLVFPMVSGAHREHAGFAVQAVEAHHVSITRLADGFISGQPLSFIITDTHDPDAPVVYHSGDTSLFSDMKLIAELYAPTLGLVGVCGVPHLPHEMTAAEGARAVEWLGVDRAVPMHLVPRSGDAEAFRDAVKERTPAVEVDIVLPGEALPLPGKVEAPR